MNRNHQQPNQSISLYQGYALVVSTMIGVGVLQFQRGIVKEAGPNGVWTILIGGLTALAEAWLVTLLMKRFPGKNIVQLTRGLLGTDKNPRLGTWLSLPFLGALSFFWLVSTAIVARTFGEVLIGAILPMTPMEVIIGTLIFSATFVVVQRCTSSPVSVNFCCRFSFFQSRFSSSHWFREWSWKIFCPCLN